MRTLARQRRRAENRLERAERILREMRDGCSLHLEYGGKGPRWALSNGREISDPIAQLVIQSSSIVDVGGALFDGCHGQVWRWWSDE